MNKQVSYAYQHLSRTETLGKCNEPKKKCVCLISFSHSAYTPYILKVTTKKLLYKAFKKNKKLLKTMDIKKKDFSIEIIDAVEEALSYCYQLKKA